MTQLGLKEEVDLLFTVPIDHASDDVFRKKIVTPVNA